MTTTRLHTSALLLCVASAIAACGGGGGGNVKNQGGAGGGQPVDSQGNAIKAEAAASFDDAQKAFAAHDKASDWSDATCGEVAKQFTDAAGKQDKFAEAYYNAGLAWDRCQKTEEAKKQFKAALDANPKFHQARTKLALYAYLESGEKAHDAAIAELKQAAITDAQFKNVEALVHLGMVYLKRNKEGDEGDKQPNDLARAQRFAQSALAVDDGYMPAYNLLALIYLESARKQAGKVTGKVATNAKKKEKEKKVGTQMLELAALVCSQAIRKSNTYAPIQNTAGMIQVELGNLNTAVGLFNSARRIDPSFYEAQMNFAAVNLQFRGFAQAEDAYRQVLKTRGNDYDARLGLALAIRGQIDDTNFDKFVAASSAELDQAKKISPDRPETYYNEAILTQEYKAKSGGPEAEPMLKKAKELFGQFVAKAGSGDDFKETVKRAKERMTEIDQIIEFNKQTEAQRKAMEAEAKNKAAEAEAAGGEGEGGEKKDEKKDEKKEEKKEGDKPAP